MIIYQKDLKTALSQALPYTTKAVIPSLTNVRLNGTSLSATNLDMAISLELSASNPIDADILIPAKLFNDAVSAMPSGDLRLDIEGKELVLRAGTTRMALRFGPADNFPELPAATGDAVILPASLIKQAAEWVTPAAAADNEASPLFASVSIETEKGITAIVATDSHRLHYVEQQTGAVDRKAIIPRAAFMELAKLTTGDSVTLTFGHGHIHFAGENATFSARLLAGQYPNWRTVITRNHAITRATVDAKELAEAIRLASVITRDEVKERQHIISLVAEGDTLAVSATSSELGKANTDLTAGVEGEPVSVWMNGKYLLDALKPFNGNVTLELSSLKPCFATEGNYTAVVLPIKQK